MGLAIVGPDVMEPEIDDAVLEGPMVFTESVFDSPRAVDAETEIELEFDTCVVRALRPDTVAFDNSEAPVIADADDLVPLLPWWMKLFEPVDDK